MTQRLMRLMAFFNYKKFCKMTKYLRHAMFLEVFLICNEMNLVAAFIIRIGYKVFHSLYPVCYIFSLC